MTAAGFQKTLERPREQVLAVGTTRVPKRTKRSGFFGLTVSLDGGLRDVDEPLRAAANG